MTAGTLSATAATPSCGGSCVDIFSHLYGTHHNPAFVLDVYKESARAGQPVILYRASNTDPAEDFTAGLQGTVNDFYTLGLVAPGIELHYKNFAAFEIQYAPYGNGTGMCVGVGSTAGNGTKVALEPCGASSKTVWVVDSYDTITGFYVPLINGSDTNFSHPFVLDYPSSAYPTDMPRPQLQTWTLRKFSSGTVVDNQMWGANLGVLP